MFQETHLTINDSPGTGDFVMAADPVVDGLSWLGQIDLRDRKTRELARSDSFSDEVTVISENKREAQQLAAAS